MVPSSVTIATRSVSCSGGSGSGAGFTTGCGLRAGAAWAGVAAAAMTAQTVTANRINMDVSWRSPAYADHIVFGALQWARLASAVPLLELDDPIWAWMESLIDAYAIR